MSQDDAAAFVAFVALGRLTENEREAFVDHEFLHRSYGDIAASMGVTKQAARTLSCRARRKLLAEVAAA